MFEQLYDLIDTWGNYVDACSKFEGEDSRNNWCSGWATTADFQGKGPQGWTCPFWISYPIIQYLTYIWICVLILRGKMATVAWENLLLSYLELLLLWEIWVWYFLLIYAVFLNFLIRRRKQVFSEIKFLFI